MKKIIEESKDIAFYVKMFPLKMHPGAYEKAKAIVCEKSLALLEVAFEKGQLPKAKCETSAVDENIRLAEKLGLSSTPASILPDGRIVRGYFDAKTFLNMIGK